MAACGKFDCCLSDLVPSKSRRCYVPWIRSRAPTQTEAYKRSYAITFLKNQNLFFKSPNNMQVMHYFLYHRSSSQRSVFRVFTFLPFLSLPFRLPFRFDDILHFRGEAHPPLELPLRYLSTVTWAVAIAILTMDVLWRILATITVEEQLEESKHHR